MTFPLKAPVVGAESAAEYLGISQQRLRQLVDERRIAVVRLGRVIAYRTSELARLKAEREGNTRFTLVSELLSAPSVPLRPTIDTVLTIWLDMDVEFHVRAWSGERLVVLMAPVNSAYMNEGRIEKIMTEIDERLLAGTGERAAWFSMSYEEGTPTQLRITNVVAQCYPVRPGSVEDPRQPARFTKPDWMPASLGEIRRIAGIERIPTFPLHGATRRTIEQYARTGEPVAVTDEVMEFDDLTHVLRALTSRQLDDRSTAQNAAIAVASTLKDRSSALEEDVATGRWYDGRINDPDAVTVARREPRLLSPAERALVEETMRGRDALNDDQLQPLYANLRAWQERVDEWSEEPDPILAADLSLAADLVAGAIRRNAWKLDPAVTPDLEYPRWSCLELNIFGPHDRNYLHSLSRGSGAGVSGDREGRIILHRVNRTSTLLHLPSSAWRFGRDIEGRFVAHLAQEGHSATFVTLWPIDLPTAGLPEDAVIVADGGVGDLPVYVAYADGAQRLLPRRPGLRSSGWNFGYGGGGPSELAAAIARAYAVARSVDLDRVPRRWINDAVTHSPKDELRISIADITRRIGTE